MNLHSPNFLSRINIKRYFILFTVLIVVIVFSQRAPIKSQEPIPLPLPESTAEVNIEIYKPAYYGLPDTIGSYHVLGVTSSQNTECLRDDYLAVILQVTENTLDEFQNSDTAEDVESAVASLGIAELRFSITGPNSDFLTLVQVTEKWNQARRMNGCLRFTPPSQASDFADDPDNTIELPE